MFDRLQQTDVSAPNRRQVGGLAASGVTWATVGTRGVRGASVSADSFSVADGSYATAGGEIYSPVVQVDSAWSYEGVDNAAQVMAGLFVDGSLVDDVVTTGTSAVSDTGTTPLSAAVVDSSAWVSEDWHAPVDGEVSHDVSVELLFEVRDSGGETLASDTATDTATVTVSDSGPEMSASVGGDGSVGLWYFSNARTERHSPNQSDKTRLFF